MGVSGLRVLDCVRAQDREVSAECSSSKGTGLGM